MLGVYIFPFRGGKQVHPVKLPGIMGAPTYRSSVGAMSTREQGSCRLSCPWPGTWIIKGTWQEESTMVRFPMAL